MKDKFQMLKDVVSCSTSSGIAQVLTFASSVVVARLLGPTDYGVWNAVSLALVYGGYCELGTSDAMLREVLILKGQGESQKAEAVERTTLGLLLASAGLVALVLLGMSFWSGFSSKMAWGLRGMAVIFVLQQVYLYQRLVLWCRNEFGVLNRFQVLSSALGACLAGALVFWFAYEGRVAAAVLTQLAVLLYAASLRKVPLVPALSLPTVWKLIKIGVPLMAVGLIIGQLTAVNRLIAVTYLGPTELGYFGIALMIAGFLALVPISTIQVLYPRLAHRFGESGRDVHALKGYLLTSTKLLAYVMAALVGFVCLMIPPLVKWLLPQYGPGVFAAQVVAAGAFFLALASVVQNFFVTTGAIKQYTIIATLALALNVALNLLLVRMGLGINGIAIGGALIAPLCYATGLIGYAVSNYTTRCREWLRFFTALYLPLAYTLLLLAGLLSVLPSADEAGPLRMLASLGAQLFLYVLGCVPLLVAAGRDMKIKFTWGLAALPAGK